MDKGRMEGWKEAERKKGRKGFEGNRQKESKNWNQGPVKK